MSKTKTPFFSMGSHGTVGDAITSQDRFRQTMLRKKPTPANPKSLPQMYQRWLYQQYAHLWTLQTVATRRAYAADGVRFHLTGFQYWMKYQLTNLPDISLLLHLDHRTNSLMPDSSPYHQHLTPYGVSTIPGRIDGAQHFDGINDYLHRSNLVGMDFGLGDFTIYYWIYLLAYDNPTNELLGTMLQAHTAEGTSAYTCYFFHDAHPNAALRRKARFMVRNAAGAAKGISTPILSLFTWHLIVSKRQDLQVFISLDAQPFVAGPTDADINLSNPLHLYMGRYTTAPQHFFYGYLDHFPVISRALDDTELPLLYAQTYP